MVNDNNLNLMQNKFCSYKHSFSQITQNLSFIPKDQSFLDQSDCIQKSFLMNKSNLTNFNIEMENSSRSEQMPSTKFPLIQSDFVDDNHQLFENDKENFISRQKMSNIFLSKYGNLAPARAIYKNINFDNIKLKSRKIVNKTKNLSNGFNKIKSNEVIKTAKSLLTDFELNDKNESNDVCKFKNDFCDSNMDFDYSPPIACSFSENEELKPPITYSTSLSDEVFMDRFVTGNLIEINEEITDEDLRNLKNHINLNAKILPPYKIIPLDTAIKTPSLALQFKLSNLHVNYQDDPRINKRYIKYEKS